MGCSRTFHLPLPLPLLSSLPPVRLSAPSTQLVGFGFAIVIVPEGNHFTDPHHVIGLVVVIITVLQPIIAFSRCHPPHVPKQATTSGKDGEGPSAPPPFRNWIDIFAICRSDAVHKKIVVQLILRLLWEILHKALGYSALVLAVTACFLGIGKLGEDPAVTPAETQVYTIILAVACGVVGVLAAIKIVLNFTLWRTWPAPSTCFCEPCPSSFMAKVNPIGGKIAKTLGWTVWTLAGAAKEDFKDKKAEQQNPLVNAAESDGVVNLGNMTGGITATEEGVNTCHLTGGSTGGYTQGEGEDDDGGIEMYNTPSGELWTEHFDEAHQTAYWVNTRTQTSSWTKPPCIARAVTSTPEIMSGI